MDPTPSFNSAPRLHMGNGSSVLLCVHHDDAYPRGNASSGRMPRLQARPRQDFAGKDGWRMYHARPFRGFHHTRTAGLRP